MRALRVCLGIFITVCLLVSFSGPASASEWDRLFPSSWDLAKARNTFKPVRVKSAGKLPADMRFTVIVPAVDWRRLAGVGDYGGARHLVSFVSPHGPAGGQLDVLTHQLKNEVNFSDWLLGVLTRSGVTVLLTRQDTGASGGIFEALGVYKSDQGNRVVRAAVIRSGQRLFIVRCSAADKAFFNLALPFAAGTLAFRPDHLKKVFLVGDWIKHNLKSRLSFLGPKHGWSAAGQAGEELVFDFSRNEKVTGRMRVRVFDRSAPDKPTPARELSRLVESLRKTGVQLKWREGSLALPKTSLPGVSCYYRAKGWSADGDLEAFALYNGGSRGVLVWMVTVGQISNLPAWMRNKRTFELACRYIRYAGKP